MPVFLSRINKEQQLYALGAIMVPLAVTIAVLAWIDGNLVRAVFYGIWSVTLGIALVVMVWKLSSRLESDKIISTILRIFHRRLMIIILWIVFVDAIVILLFILPYLQASLYRFLETVLILIMVGAFLVFARFWPASK